MTTNTNKQLESTPIQLAGHISFGESNIPCITFDKENNTVLKLIQPPPKGQNEFIFYRHTKVYIDQYKNEQYNESTIKIDRSSTQNSLTTTHETLSDSGISDSSKVAILSKISNSKDEDLNLTADDQTSQQQQPTTCIKRFIKNYSLEQNIFNNLKLDKNLIQKLINDFLPKFYGTKQINGYDYIELENLGYNFIQPNMADVKIGKVTYDPDADQEKIIRRSKKWPPLKMVGYQFLGIKRNENGDQQLDRNYFRSLSINTYKSAIYKFLPSSYKKRLQIIPKYIQKIDEIISWFQSQNCIQFYASSLLLAYCSQNNDIAIKMIDFAHVFYEEEKIDDNYLFGIQNFKRDLLEIYNKDIEIEKSS